MSFSRSFHRLFWPLVFLTVFVGPAVYWDDMLQEMGFDAITETIRVMRYGFAISAWLSVAWVINRIIDTFIWDRIVAPRLGGKVPRLLKDVLSAIIFLTAITGIVGVVFKLPVTGLWATSGVVGLVVGLALQSMIADVFSGIAINLDRPFAIGDWIRLHQRGVSNLIGCVEEINWRSTRLKTADNVRVVIPNSLLSTIVLANLSKPDEKSRFDMIFTLDFTVPTERALRIMNAAVKAANGPLMEPAAKARVTGTSDWGVQYKVRYWLLPREVSPNKGRHAVASSVLQHLHQAGITLAYPKRDVYQADMPARQLDLNADRESLVKRIDIFQAFEEEELAQVAGAMVEHTIKSGRSVVAEGDDGNSMYLLVEGLLYVFVKPDEDGDSDEDLHVGQIVPGQFFGEMSLLTGEPRSATVTAATGCVVFEITKETIMELIHKRADIAAEISRMVARRRIATSQAKQTLGRDEKIEHEQNVAEQLLRKMKNFFGLRS